MDSLLSLFAVMAFAIFAVSTAVTLIALRAAPEGTEDESGFHSEELARRFDVAAATARQSKRETSADAKKRMQEEVMASTQHPFAL